jgi:hypothetical protein
MKPFPLALTALLVMGAGSASAVPVSFNNNFASLFQTHSGAGTGYVDTFEFELGQESSANFGIFSFATTYLGQTNDYDISSVTLTGPSGGSFSFTQLQAPSGMEIFAFAPIDPLLLGSYILRVVGAVAPTASVGSYSGSLTVSAVPEPQTYSMMAVGLAGIGWVLRRRRSVPK